MGNGEISNEPASVPKATPASVSAKPDAREYSRFFGQPHIRDVRALRESETRASEQMIQQIA